MQLGTFTTRRVLFLAQQGKCFYCGRYLSPWAFEPGNEMGWSLDHFWPTSKKGNMPKFYRRRNYVMSCFRCNAGKGSKLPNKQQMDKHINLYTLLGKV